MFYFLHRLVKWFFTALVLAGLYWVWLQREAVEPVYVWYDVYENGGIKNDDRLHVLQGRATAVVDGHTIQMNHDGKSYAVRLTGLQMAEPPFTQTEIRLEKERRQVLRDMVLSKQVEVQVTYAAPNSLLGIVTLNQTNLNLYFITNGLATFNPAFVKTAPRHVQYQFFAAERWREKKDQREMAVASAAP